MSNQTSKVDLKAATARPWNVAKNNAGAIPVHFQPIEVLGRNSNCCVAASLGNGPESEANAALIVQAVNSFEAMREACRKMVAHRMLVAAHREANKSSSISEVDLTKQIVAELDLEEAIEREAEAALKLAEGGGGE